MSFLEKKIAFDCYVCGRPIYVGDVYYSLELGKFRLHDDAVHAYHTTVIEIQELFVFCRRCAKNNIFQKVLSVVNAKEHFKDGRVCDDKKICESFRSVIG